MATYDPSKDYFEQIDSVLSNVPFANRVSFDGNMHLSIESDLYVLAMKQLTADGYLVRDPNGGLNPFLTSSGLLFINQGGYKAKFAEDERTRRLNNAQVKSVIRTNKAQRKLTRTSLAIAVAAVIVAAIPLIPRGESEQAKLQATIRQQQLTIDRLLQSHQALILTNQALLKDSVNLK